MHTCPWICCIESRVLLTLLLSLEEKHGIQIMVLISL
jgi:hypothetical protein